MSNSLDRIFRVGFTLNGVSYIYFVQCNMMYAAGKQIGWPC